MFEALHFTLPLILRRCSSKYRDTLLVSLRIVFELPKTRQIREAAAARNTATTVTIMPEALMVSSEVHVEEVVEVFPAGHAAHVEAPTKENLPTAQSVQLN